MAFARTTTHTHRLIHRALHIIAHLTDHFVDSTKSCRAERIREEGVIRKRILHHLIHHLVRHLVVRIHPLEHVVKGGGGSTLPSDLLLWLASSSRLLSQSTLLGSIVELS